MHRRWGVSGRPDEVDEESFGIIEMYIATTGIRPSLFWGGVEFVAAGSTAVPTLPATALRERT